MLIRCPKCGAEIDSTIETRSATRALLRAHMENVHPEES